MWGWMGTEWEPNEDQSDGAFRDRISQLKEYKEGHDGHSEWPEKDDLSLYKWVHTVSDVHLDKFENKRAESNIIQKAKW